jgi:hypothetical protein
LVICKIILANRFFAYFDAVKFDVLTPLSERQMGKETETFLQDFLRSLLYYYLL